MNNESTINQLIGNPNRLKTRFTNSHKFMDEVSV